MIRINLIDEKILVDRRCRRHLRRWLAVCLASAAIGAVPVIIELTRQSQVYSLKAEKRQVGGRIESTRAHLNTVGVQMRTLDAQMSRADALRTKRSWSRLLGLISQLTPEEMWFITVSTDPPAPRGGDQDLTTDNRRKSGEKDDEPRIVTLDAPRALSFDGYTLEHRFLYEFMSNLQGTGIFDEVTLTKATEEPVLKSRAVRFSILCRW